MSLPSSFDVKTEGEKTTDEMTVGEKVLFYCKQQPLVPLGCLLTTGAVVMAAMSVKQGNKRKAQYFFRWRVAFQTATLVALVAGSYIYGNNRRDSKAKEELLREKARVREALWIQELERREQETQARKKRAELARLRTQENEESIKKLEQELRELEGKLKPSSD